MNRACYSEDCDGWALIRWRGAVESAIRGKRGQEFLKELLATLDAMPDKRLIADDLVTAGGEVCALGSVLVARKIEQPLPDLEDADSIAGLLNIAQALVREIEFENDEFGRWNTYKTIEDKERARWQYMRTWVESQIKKEQDTNARMP